MQSNLFLKPFKTIWYPNSKSQCPSPPSIAFQSQNHHVGVNHMNFVNTGCQMTHDTLPLLQLVGLRDWSLITRSGELQGETCIKEIPPHLIKVGNFLRPPPPSVWLILQASVFKLLQNMLCPPPFCMAKTLNDPPFLKQ